MALLAERVRELGLEVVVTREPGGTPIGERIRELLLRGEARDALTDALLFNAARRQLVAEVIRPALDRWAVVMCDRFADSTLAYQGYGAGIPLDRLRVLAEIATDGLRPQRTILFDLASETGLSRRSQGEPSEVNRFESAAIKILTAEQAIRAQRVVKEAGRGGRHDLNFHRRVRSGFLELAAAEPQLWRVIDAERPAAEVADAVWEAVRDLFSRH
jgi:dTMP kinase